MPVSCFFSESVGSSKVGVNRRIGNGNGGVSKSVALDRYHGRVRRLGTLLRRGREIVARGREAVRVLVRGRGWCKWGDMSLCY